MKMFVIFGLPGAGKSFVGQIMQKYFGYFLYEADQDMPDELKNAIERQTVVTDTLRAIFFEKINERVNQIQKEHDNIVITQTFIKEKYRKQFLENFPKSQFLLIVAPTKIRQERLLQRKDWQLDLVYWEKMAKLFEIPHITHNIIVNKTDGEIEVKEQLQRLLI